MRDNSIVDIGWGFLFIVPNLFAMIKLYGMDIPHKQALMLALIFLWGVRLSLHIGSRHTGVEDFRYQTMRRNWSPKG